MRLSRIYLPCPLAAGDTIDFDENTGHYVRTVLRLAKNSEITVFNGQGGEFSAVLTLVSRKCVTALIGGWRANDSESSLIINLGLGISRGERMDFAIQKSVELGVHSIAPLTTERSVVKLDGERHKQKQSHWQKIAQHACEQCGRVNVPNINEATTLDEWLACQSGLKLFFSPHANTTIDQLTPRPSTIHLLSGPEGGFSDRERQLAKNAGFVAVRLGPRTLRTETAALAAIAIVQTLWGDLGDNKQPTPHP